MIGHGNLLIYIIPKCICSCLGRHGTFPGETSSTVITFLPMLAGLPLRAPPPPPGHAPGHLSISTPVLSDCADDMIALRLHGLSVPRSRTCNGGSSVASLPAVRELPILPWARGPVRRTIWKIDQFLGLGGPADMRVNGPVLGLCPIPSPHKWTVARRLPSGRRWSTLH